MLTLPSTVNNLRRGLGCTSIHCVPSVRADCEYKVNDMQYQSLLVKSRRFGVLYWTTGGTTLGIVRHGGLIPWDDDLDICILQQVFAERAALWVPIYIINFKQATVLRPAQYLIFDE